MPWLTLHLVELEPYVCLVSQITIKVLFLKKNVFSKVLKTGENYLGSGTYYTDKLNCINHLKRIKLGRAL